MSQVQLLLEGGHGSEVCPKQSLTRTTTQYGLVSPVLLTPCSLLDCLFINIHVNILIVFWYSWCLCSIGSTPTPTHTNTHTHTHTHTLENHETRTEQEKWLRNMCKPCLEGLFQPSAGETRGKQQAVSNTQQVTGAEGQLQLGFTKLSLSTSEHLRCDVSLSSLTSTGGWPLHQGYSHTTAGLTGQHRSVTAQARDTHTHTREAKSSQTVKPLPANGALGS